MTRALCLLVAGLLAGCADRNVTMLGSPFEGTPVSIAAAGKIDAAARVVVRGTMTDKCPVAGCWFILRDETGTIRVDTKNGGFAVVDVPVNTPLVVAGWIVTNGAERSIDATGVRY